MKKVIATLLALLLPITAFAQLSASAGALSGSQAQSGSASLSVANPVAQSSSNQGTGNAQNITFNSAPNPTETYQQVDHTGTSTVRTVPQVYVPTVLQTAPCRVAFAGGLSVVGVGVAGGGSVGDSPCNLRELSRLYHGIGNPAKAVAVADAALALECQDEAVAKALGGLCQPAAGQLPAPVAAAPVVEPVRVSKAPVCYETTDAMGIKTTRCPN